MGNARRVLIGLGIASGAFFAAWLLSGPRKDKTRAFLEQKVRTIKQTMGKRKRVIFDDSEANYYG